METTIVFPSDTREMSEKDMTQITPYSITHSTTRRFRPLNLIVAMAGNGAIGRGGDLLWHLRGDMRHFKELTMGHPVIMGRNTWLSLPKGALPGRRNIVLSRTPGFAPDGAEVAGSLEEALDMCDEGVVPFIIGGAHVYAAALPWVTAMYLTLVDDAPEDADTFFPEFDRAEWNIAETSDSIAEPGAPSYRFQTLSRK